MLTEWTMTNWYFILVVSEFCDIHLWKRKVGFVLSWTLGQIKFITIYKIKSDDQALKPNFVLFNNLKAEYSIKIEDTQTTLWNDVFRILGTSKRKDLLSSKIFTKRVKGREIKIIKSVIKISNTILFIIELKYIVTISSHTVYVRNFKYFAVNHSWIVSLKNEARQ